MVVSEGEVEVEKKKKKRKKKEKTVLDEVRDDGTQC